MGRAPEVAWEESARELYELYRRERDTERRKRVHALWLVRSGRPRAEAAEHAGIGKRTLERWLSWYRRGRLKEVLERVPGRGAPGSACRLDGEQLEELVAHAGEGRFRHLRRSPGLGGARMGCQLRVQGDVRLAP